MRRSTGRALLATLPLAALATLLATLPRAAVLRTPARILVWLVLASTRFRTRRVRAFFDFELRCRYEFHLSLEHLLDVAQQSHLVGRDQGNGRAGRTRARCATNAMHVVLGNIG